MLLCSQSSYPYWQFWSRNGGKSIHVISARYLCMEETCLAASQYIFLVIWFPIFPYTCLFIDSTIEYRFSKRCHKKWEKKNFMLYPAISYCFVWWTTQICTSTHSFLNTFSSSDNDSSPYVTIPFLYHVLLSSFIMSFCLRIVLSWKMSFQLSYNSITACCFVLFTHGVILDWISELYHFI